MNIYIPYTRLPSEYQEVEYIQSSGTQYFILGSSFKTSYKSVIDLQMDVTGGDYIPLGVNSPSPYKKYGINAYGGYFKVVAGGTNWANSKSEDTNRHTLIIDKDTVTVDGTDYSINYVDYTYSYGIGVFAYKEYDAMRYHSSNKLYSLQIYDENGDKIYDLVPCYRKSDNVIGMYDLVNNQFYTNQGTGTFSKGNDVTMSVLKNIYIGEYEFAIKYQEVEWIGGMGITNSSDTDTMRIDTGINATSSVGVYAKMYKIGTRNDTEWFYANIDGTTSRRGLTTYPSGNWCPQWETWRQTNIAYNTQQWYEIKFNYNNNKQTLIDNTNIYSMTSATFNSNNNVFIGRESHGSSYGWRCAFFKITDGTTLVRDLVPCYRKSDNVIGMYDLVNNQFYTNSGSGTFTKGPDVN